MASTIKISAPEYSIKSVTVFKSSRAEVVRTFSVDLKAGQNKVEIRGLPSTIDTQSVRVSGLGEARLFDVVCTIGSNKAAVYDPDSSSELIRTLRVKQEALESEKRVREHEADLLLNYAKTLNGEHVTPQSMGQFLESFVDQGRKNLEAVTSLGEKIIEVYRQIEKETDKLAAKKGSANGEVTVVVVAKEICTIELKLTYIVSDASWQPTYELHATTENGKPSSSVSLHYRARVNQSTGEDWKDTTLTLSTVASDIIATSIPQLAAIKIRPQSNFFKQKKNILGDSGIQSNNTNNAFGPPIRGVAPPTQIQQGLIFGQIQQAPAFGQSQQAPIFSQSQQPSLFGQSQQQQPTFQPGGGLFGFAPPPPLASVPLHEDCDDIDPSSFEEVAMPSAFSEPTTVVTETPLAISYSVDGESTIPSDGVAHQVSIAILPFDAKISHVTIPRIEPRVYLQCEVKNSSEYRLLPGFVIVILDDSYVSKTRINDINTGDTFDCTLGADPAAKVTYSRSSRTVRAAGGAFSEVTNTTTYTTKISVQNKHQFAISDLLVCDVIPMCDDKRAKVVLRKPDGLADAKDGQVIDLKKDGLKVLWEKVIDGKGGEKEGKFEWRWKVDSGAKVTLEAEWEVKAPADIQWVETVMPLH